MWAEKSLLETLFFLLLEYPIARHPKMGNLAFLQKLSWQAPGNEDIMHSVDLFDLVSGLFYWHNALFGKSAYISITQGTDRQSTRTSTCPVISFLSSACLSVLSLLEVILIGLVPGQRASSGVEFKNDHSKAFLFLIYIPCLGYGQGSSPTPVPCNCRLGELWWGLKTVALASWVYKWTFVRLCLVNGNLLLWIPHDMNKIFSGQSATMQFCPLNIETCCPYMHWAQAHLSRQYAHGSTNTFWPLTIQIGQPQGSLCT